MKIALIPARSGSKRVPDKNIRELNGCPLIEYSISTAYSCETIDKVVVSTNSDMYAEIAKEAVAEVLMRPDDISTGNTPDTPVVEHFLEHYPECTQVIYLRPTTPLRDSRLVARAIKEFDDCLRLSAIPPDSLRSVEEMSESAYKCFTVKSGILKGLMVDAEKTNLPNHFYPETYKANGYVDIIMPKTIKQYGDIYGSRIKAFETEPVTEVDSEREWKILQLELAT